MVPLVERPRDLRCNVETNELTQSWTVTVRPFPADECAWLALFLVVCALSLWFGVEVWGWRKDSFDWSLIVFVGLGAASLSWVCLARSMVKELRVSAGELSVTKSILGISRHFRLQDGGFELQRLHASADMKDEPYEFQLEVVEPTGQRVKLVRNYWWDKSFVLNLLGFLCDATGWKSVEMDVYSPPPRSGESGP